MLKIALCIFAAIFCVLGMLLFILFSGKKQDEYPIIYKNKKRK